MTLLSGGGGGGGAAFNGGAITGGLTVSYPGQDKTVVIVGDAASANDALVVTDSANPGSIAAGIDPFGYISALGIAVGGGDVRLIQLGASLPGRTNNIVEMYAGATPLFVIDKFGNIIMGNLPGSAPATSKTLWNNAGVVTITA